MPKKADIKKEYFESVGRRKTSTARVRIWNKGDKVVIVNDKQLKDYFQSETLQKTVLGSLEELDLLEKFYITIKVIGGGISSQAEAARHGISRSLVEMDPELRDRLKLSGYLTRDSRMRERKKFGLRRARRAPQWSKR